MMSLTHGVHGIGDVLAISVHADPVNVDVDDYLPRLRPRWGSTLVGGRDVGGDQQFLVQFEPGSVVGVDDRLG